jgi:hypothetical protein
MTAQPIAPVIPSLARRADRGHGTTRAARPLPVAAAPEIPAAPDEVLYGFGRIDASGRVADRTIISALGWRPGDRLTLTAAAGVITARRDPGGLVTMPARPYVVIPAALRRRCGLRPGDRVLLAVRSDSSRICPGTSLSPNGPHGHGTAGTARAFTGTQMDRCHQMARPFRCHSW